MSKIPSKAVSIVLYDEQLNKIKEFGKVTGMNRSEIIREAIQEFFDKKEIK